MERVGDKKVDVVMSDMAPNFSGMPAVDIFRAMYLVELALDMCKQVLATNGCFVVKVFQGEGFDDYLKEIDHYLTQLKYVNLRHHVDDPVRYIVAMGYM